MYSLFLCRPLPLLVGSTLWHLLPSKLQVKTLHLIDCKIHCIVRFGCKDWLIGFSKSMVFAIGWIWLELDLGWELLLTHHDQLDHLKISTLAAHICVDRRL